MKSLLRNIINTAGFDIHRLRPSEKIVSSQIIKNITIELIGPSGIGKSTILSDVSKHLQYPWNRKYPRRVHSSLKENHEIDKFYRLCLHFKALAVFEHSLNFQHYAQLLSFFSYRAIGDRNLSISGLLEKGGWLLDESFCHNFTSEINKIIEDDLIDSDTLNNFFKGRNFIVVTASTDWILRNLRDRQKKKPEALNNWLGVYDESYLIEQIQKSFEKKRKLAEYGLSYGSRSYQINLSNDKTKALDSFLEIEHKIVVDNRSG